MLKQVLIESPILQRLNWNLPFKIICDVLDYIMGEIMGKQVDKKPIVLCYTSKTLFEVQMYYMTIEKELLIVVHALEKIQPYILGRKIIYTDHATLMYLSSKKEANLRMI